MVVNPDRGAFSLMLSASAVAGRQSDIVVIAIVFVTVIVKTDPLSDDEEPPREVWAETDGTLIDDVSIALVWLTTDEASDDEGSAAAARAQKEMVELARKVRKSILAIAEAGLLKSLLTWVFLIWSMTVDGALRKAVARGCQRWRLVGGV